MHISRRTALRIGAAAFAVPALARAKSPTPNLKLLQSAMAHGRFVTYQPTALQVIGGKLTNASVESIRADLRTLRPYFDSLITYGAQGGAEHIPALAAEQGFRAVVLGVWDFNDKTELVNALAAARSQPIVAGLSLGNEMILAKRASWGDLENALDKLHAQLPSMPLTVTEPFAEFLDQADAKPTLARMDFMLVNIHPIFESWFHSAKPQNWAEFVVNASALLAKAYPGPILIKESGTPTAPPALNFTPAMQRDFYRALEKQFPPTATRAFSYFSAFDAPWRVNDVVVGGGTHPEEAHWGLFEANRTPKPVMSGFPPLVKSR